MNLARLARVSGAYSELERTHRKEAPCSGALRGLLIQYYGGCLSSSQMALSSTGEFCCYLCSFFWGGNIVINRLHVYMP